MFDISQEVASLRVKLDAERNKTLGLGSRVAKLGQVLSASQEALQQEKKTVETMATAASDAPDSNDKV